VVAADERLRPAATRASLIAASPAISVHVTLRTLCDAACSRTGRELSATPSSTSDLSRALREGHKTARRAGQLGEGCAAANRPGRPLAGG
jgi:hypothetical protein